VRYVGGYEVGETEWLSAEHFFLADRDNTMTIELLSEKFPWLAKKEEKKPRVDAGLDSNFLKAWLKTAQLPEEVRREIQEKLPSFDISKQIGGVVEDVLWWRKIEGDPPDDVNATREFKVKWSGCCYRKSQWLSRKVLLHLAQRKLQNFERKWGLSLGPKSAGADEDDEDEAQSEESEEEEEEEDVFEGIRADWLQVSMILESCVSLCE
jgi:hypothetical protein